MPRSPLTNQAELRTLIVSALGIAITTWDIAFNLGVHGDIFYSKLQTLWVASSVILLAVVLTGKTAKLLTRWGIVALLSPTIWFAFNALTPQVDVRWYEEFIWLIALGVFVVAIPYILYILLQLTASDAVLLSAEYRNRLITIVLLVALVGYGVGRFNEYFVSCEQFHTAGDAIPLDCANWQNNTGSE